MAKGKGSPWVVSSTAFLNLFSRLGARLWGYVKRQDRDITARSDNTYCRIQASVLQLQHNTVNGIPEGWLGSYRNRDNDSIPKSAKEGACENWQLWKYRKAKQKPSRWPGRKSGRGIDSENWAFQARSLACARVKLKIGHIKFGELKGVPFHWVIANLFTWEEPW